MKKKITLIILVILFIVFSFFSCFSYQLLLTNEQEKKQNKMKENIGKHHEMEITYQLKQETIYNKNKNSKVNYSYYDTNIIIPGNEMASTNIKQYLKQEMALDETIKEKVQEIKSKNKEYILDQEIKIVYASNRVLSFYYKLLGNVEEKEINQVKVFSLNISTGTRLFYKDISANPRKLKNRLKSYIQKELIKYDEKTYAKIDKEIDKENFYLSKEELVIIINKCDLFSCSYGNVIVKVPYKEISDVINSKYYEKRFL